MRYWINTVSFSHVRNGIEGGFTQADHGKNTRLRLIEKGDFIVFYSPRTDLHGGAPLQSFTAIGRISDDEPYQVEMTPDFRPWRRQVEFFECTEAPIAPMIRDLVFIGNKKKWGFPFRRGLFEVGREDFARIAEAMQATLEP